MKLKRQKKVGRILSFFQHNFGHRKPYQVLLDGTFCQACLSMKINIRDQLPKYLGEVKLLTTKCCIQEVEKLGPELSGATMILKQFSLHQCGHDEAPRPAAKCLKSMLGEKNPQRYFVATQDAELRARARNVPGTPILYLHHCAPTLEKPSEMSSAKADADLEEKISGDFHSRVLAAIKRKELGEPGDQAVPKKRKKKGVNPLACLKKKTPKPVKRLQSQGPAHVEEESKLEMEKKKRKRNRKRKKPESSEDKPSEN